MEKIDRINEINKGGKEVVRNEWNLTDKIKI